MTNMSSSAVFLLVVLLAGALSISTEVVAATAAPTEDAELRQKAIKWHRERLKHALEQRDEASRTVASFKVGKASAETSESDEPTDDVAEQPTEDAPSTTVPSEAKAVATEALAAAEYLQRAQKDISALETTIAVLKGAKVSLEELETALDVQKQELQETHLQHDAVKAIGSTPTDEVRAQIEVLDFTVRTLENAIEARKGPDTTPETKKTQKEIEFTLGGRLKYGLTVSLLRFSVSRPSDEPGRLRGYEPSLDFIPAEFGFQFVYQPPKAPWRLERSDGNTYQLMSAGGMLLARVDSDDVQRGGLSLAATLSFFEELIGFGVGVDLYRGIPILGADGTAGGDIAFTGLLAWAFARDGEVTPENVFVVFTLGLEPLVKGLSGEVKP